MIYDKLASGYDRFLEPFERRFLRLWRKEALSYLPSDAVILEIGAGTGSNFPFYPPFKCAVASEISFKMIEIAKNKTDAIPIIQSDGEKLPFEDNSFDAAFATLVFCSISRPELAFSELIRVVKTNGPVILLEHVRPGGLFGYVFDVLNIFTVALFEDHFNRQTANLAESAGLRIVEVKKKWFGSVNLIICEIVI